MIFDVTQAASSLPVTAAEIDADCDARLDDGYTTDEGGGAALGNMRPAADARVDAASIAALRAYIHASDDCGASSMTDGCEAVSFRRMAEVAQLRSDIDGIVQQPVRRRSMRMAENDDEEPKVDAPPASCLGCCCV